MAGSVKADSPVQQGLDGLDIDFCGGQQDLAQGFAIQLLQRGGEVGALDVENLPHQREAVGVNAGGGQADEGVPFPDPASVDDFGLVHHAHGKARDVIVVGVHDAGVLGGLAANQGAAGLDAALRHAGDDGGDFLRLVFADGDIVQEEQGPGAAADDVVDAHGHAVDADGVVLVQQLGQAQLGAHAVGAGDENRF